MVLDLFEGAADEGRLIACSLNEDIGRKVFPNAFKPCQDIVNDLDGVGPGLLPDHEGHRLPAVQAGTKGSVRLVGNWVVYLPPSPDRGETDSFTYTLRDGKGGESVGWVQVRVAGAPGGLTQSLLEIAVDPVTKWVTIQFAGIPHRTYEIQRTTSFPGGVWETLGTAPADATGLFGFTDENPPASAAYYRSADLTHP